MPRKTNTIKTPAVLTPAELAAAVASAEGAAALLALLPDVDRAERAVIGRTMSDTFTIKHAGGDILWRAYVATKLAASDPVASDADPVDVTFAAVTKTIGLVEGNTDRAWSTMKEDYAVRQYGRHYDTAMSGDDAPTSVRTLVPAMRALGRTSEQSTAHATQQRVAAVKRAQREAIKTVAAGGKLAQRVETIAKGAVATLPDGFDVDTFRSLTIEQLDVVILMAQGAKAWKRANRPATPAAQVAAQAAVESTVVDAAGTIVMDVANVIPAPATIVPAWNGVGTPPAAAPVDVAAIAAIVAQVLAAQTA